MNDSVNAGGMIEVHSHYRTAARLADLQTCGEDLALNLDIIAQVAPTHCIGCGGHHIRYAVSRLVFEKTPINIDRAEMVRFIRDHIAALDDRSRTIDIVIAGAADTGILATCAHAVADMGATAERVRFVVIDICETPLALCRAFGRWHGLNVETRQMDLTRMDARYDADIIVLHSILRQIPPEKHLSLLAELGSWLRRGGVFLFSTRLNNLPARLPKERQMAILAERQGRGEIRLSVPLESIGAALVLRSHWSHDFENGEEIGSLFERAAFVVKDERYVEQRCDSEGLPPVESRYVAILAPRAGP